MLLSEQDPVGPDLGAAASASLTERHRSEQRPSLLTSADETLPAQRSVFNQVQVLPLVAPGSITQRPLLPMSGRLELSLHQHRTLPAAYAAVVRQLCLARGRLPSTADDDWPGSGSGRR